MMLGSSCSPCCVSDACDFSVPAPSDLVTVSAESSVYGTAVYQLQHGQPLPLPSKANCYIPARYTEDLNNIASQLTAYFYPEASPQLPIEQHATWARFNIVDVTTSCQSFNPGTLVGGSVRVRFFGSNRLISQTSNIYITVYGTNGGQVSDSRLSVNSYIQVFALGLPAGFIVSSVVVRYEFLTATDPLFVNKSLPTDETITFRGFYDASGRQLMYRFADNFPLP